MNYILLTYTVATYIEKHHIDIINIYTIKSHFYYGILYVLPTYIFIYPKNVHMWKLYTVFLVTYMAISLSI